MSDPSIQTEHVVRRQKSSRAGVTFPVGRIHRQLKRKFNGPITETSSVYLTGVLEYLTREVLDASANITRLQKRKRITSRSIYLGLQADKDLKELYRSMDVLLPSAGVVPNKKTKTDETATEKVFVSCQLEGHNLLLNKIEGRESHV
jgi:histone H2A